MRTRRTALVRVVPQRELAAEQQACTLGTSIVVRRASPHRRWCTKDGRVIFVREMTNEHLCNTLRWIVALVERRQRMHVNHPLYLPDGSASNIPQDSQLSPEEIAEHHIPVFRDMQDEAFWRGLQWHTLPHGVWFARRLSESK